MDDAAVIRSDVENLLESLLETFIVACQMKHRLFLLCYSMNYRDFSVKSKLTISLFQTVKLSL